MITIQVGLCFNTLVGHLTVAMYKVELADYHHCYRDYDDDDKMIMMMVMIMMTVMMMIK